MMKKLGKVALVATKIYGLITVGTLCKLGVASLIRKHYELSEADPEFEMSPTLQQAVKIDSAALDEADELFRTIRKNK